MPKKIRNKTKAKLAARSSRRIERTTSLIQPSPSTQEASPSTQQTPSSNLHSAPSTQPPTISTQEPSPSSQQPSTFIRRHQSAIQLPSTANNRLSGIRLDAAGPSNENAPSRSPPSTAPSSAWGSKRPSSVTQLAKKLQDDKQGHSSVSPFTLTMAVADAAVPEAGSSATETAAAAVAPVPRTWPPVPTAAASVAASAAATAASGALTPAPASASAPASVSALAPVPALAPVLAPAPAPAPASAPAPAPAPAWKTVRAATASRAWAPTSAAATAAHCPPEKGEGTTDNEPDFSKQTLGLASRWTATSATAKSTMPPPERLGEAGGPINLITNFFDMKIPKNLRVYTHTVLLKRQISYIKQPDRIERVDSSAPGAQRGWVDVSKDEPVFYNRNVFDAFLRAEGQRLQSALAYDGRSIAYSAKRLDPQVLNKDFTIVVDDDGCAVPPNAGNNISRETVKVQVYKSSSVLNFSDYFDTNQHGLHREPFQAALDVALANGPARTHVMVGRSFYSSLGEMPLGQHNVTAMAWRGFYQSVRPTRKGLMVNMDQSFTAFWKGGGEPLLRLVKDANGGRPLSVQDPGGLRIVAKKLMMLKLRARHTGITFKLQGFSDRNADDYHFEHEGRMMSVREYFHEKYRINLEASHLPLVKVKRDTYVPLEMLDVVEKQRVKGMLQPDQIRSIVTVASTKPKDRMSAALSKMVEIMHTPDAVRESFEIGVNPQLVRVRGRVLPVPDILYGSAQSSKPQGGQWFAPKKGGFALPCRLSNWIILNNSREDSEEIDGFISDFRSAGQRAEVPISWPRSVEKVGREGIGSRMQSVFEKNLAPSKDKSLLQLVMVVQNRQDVVEYNEIKRLGDLKYGVPTQVLLSKNLTNRNQKRRSMFCDNVLLKVNAKLGGSNSVVRRFEEVRSSGMKDPKFLNDPHIVLGADVTHPVPGGNTCSVAALVGSRDMKGMQFSGSIRNQGSRVEIIQDLGSMFQEIYMHWLLATGMKKHAESIIMFRDGVADGQYEQVLSVELASLRRSCEDIQRKTGGRLKPRITYVIVTKRHHARFYAEDKRMQDRSGNIPPGTVVDHTVTSADYYEFYVNSHAGIQGTSKPSKYVVLLDENNMSVDELQGYVFRLSHGYARCNRSVSMVNSAYYAHLLAFRGRAYLQEGLEVNSNPTNPNEVERTAEIHKEMRNKLYFV